MVKQVECLCSNSEADMGSGVLGGTGYFVQVSVFKKKNVGLFHLKQALLKRSDGGWEIYVKNTKCSRNVQEVLSFSIKVHISRTYQRTHI